MKAVPTPAQGTSIGNWCFCTSLPLSLHSLIPPTTISFFSLFPLTVVLFCLVSCFRRATELSEIRNLQFHLHLASFPVFFSSPSLIWVCWSPSLSISHYLPFSLAVKWSECVWQWEGVGGFSFHFTGGCLMLLLSRLPL